MFITIQAHEYTKYATLLDRMFRLRKRVFADQLNWDVPVVGELERDAYDNMNPVYLVWCSDDQQRLYGCMRMMPTTGPTLLYDTFRATFPDACDLIAPGIWECTRTCVDTDALAADYPEIDAGRAFSMIMLASCECGLDHGIHTMVSNYEPHFKRIYSRAGVKVDELGRADEYGKYPVCCGAFEISDRVLATMRHALTIDTPLYRRATPVRPITSDLLMAA